MKIESTANRDTPVCIYFSEGRCLFNRGVSIPSLARIEGGRPKTSDLPGDFPLSGQGKLVDPSLKTETLCGGRLRFGAYRGVYQKANCDQYASNEPGIKLQY